jgi:FHA domain-containing protein/von Willebrand factor type A domain-containing protein
MGRFMSRLAWQAKVALIASALNAGDLAVALAQQPTATQPPPPSNIQATIVPGRQSPGVPAGEVACTGNRGDDKPTLRCLVRFNGPIDVIGASVVSASGGREWTAAFQAFDPAVDDTAFLVLVDRSEPARSATVQRSTRELADVFARIGPRQRVAVASFAGDITILQNFTSDAAAIRNAFGRIRAEGSSSELFRHALDAIRRLEAVVAGRRVLIIASPAKTADKAFTRDEVERAARQAGVRIVALGYAERDPDQSFLQTLERLSQATQGVSYRVPIATKALPNDFRQTILTRFGAGGIVQAEAPSRDVPAAVDVTLRHPENRTTTFAANLAAGPSLPEKMTRLDRDKGVFEQGYDWALDNAWWAVAVGLGLVVALVILVMALRSRRRPEKVIAPAPVPPPYEPSVAPPAGAEPAEQPEIDEIRAGHVSANPAAQSEAEAPVIAWLEFNGSPGRFPVRKKHITIGRQTDNDVVTDPNEDTVSRHHAVVTINTDGRFQITNRSHEYRSNPNPIFVNGRERDHAELTEGDTVKLGTGAYGFVFRAARKDA